MYYIVTVSPCRYYERQMAKSVRPRNSASMGNILDVRQSSLEYAPLPPPREPKSKVRPIYVAIDFVSTIVSLRCVTLTQLASRFIRG